MADRSGIEEIVSSLFLTGGNMQLRREVGRDLQREMRIIVDSVGGHRKYAVYSGTPPQQLTPAEHKGKMHT